MRIKRILFMLKFSEKSKGMLRAALEVAKSCNARFHVLHVMDHRLAHPEIPDALVADATREIEKHFKDEYMPLLGEFKNYYFNCWEGSPANDTAKFAQVIGADLIIVGSHESGGKLSFNRLGTVGATIMQYAPCPVMLLPGTA